MKLQKTNPNPPPSSPMASFLPLLFFFFFFFFFSIFSSLAALEPQTVFNVTSFGSNNTDGIIYTGSARDSLGGIVDLTVNQLNFNLENAAGHATYATPIDIWDPATRQAADFSTRFDFIIKLLDQKTNGEGDGIAFFLAPTDYSLPLHSSGGYLGLFNSSTSNATSTKLLAVEFDTYKNDWDLDDNHIGINTNSIVSNFTLRLDRDLKRQTNCSAVVGYNATSKELYVFFSRGGEAFSQTPNISYPINITEVLPPKVIVGLSGATGNSYELHQILTWSFVASGIGDERAKKHWVVVVVAVGAAVVVLATALVCFLLHRMGMCRWRGGASEAIELGKSMDDKFVRDTGSRRFTYKELVAATNNFSNGSKLGQGGFGAVHLGVLQLGLVVEKVAVKRFTKKVTSQKEYISEATVISRLRHRNLVQLKGWCHDSGEFLLVYEYMPNGSLDSYVFGGKMPLPWPARHKIAQGLASALLYLHEEWEQCVVHRDVKSSNVLLDSEFNAKLGDFGLARLIDHELGSQTTMPAGTRGYVAPETVLGSKARKESDVYSFGVVALEIACGRRPVDHTAGDDNILLVEWVWRLYGERRLLEAVDQRLHGNFDVQQIETLMTLGLWCAHPDLQSRPTMSQAIRVLALEASPPSLPPTMPRPTYGVPHLPMDGWSSSSIAASTSSGKAAMVLLPPANSFQDGR